MVGDYGYMGTTQNTTATATDMAQAIADRDEFIVYVTEFDSTGLFGVRTVGAIRIQPNLGDDLYQIECEDFGFHQNYTWSNLTAADALDKCVMCHAKLRARRP